MSKAPEPNRGELALLLLALEILAELRAKREERERADRLDAGLRLLECLDPAMPSA